MPTTQPRDRRPPGGTLALHVRQLRQWYGESGLSQRELATLAGITPRAVCKYESATRLPTSLACLVAVAAALRVPIERLIDPRLREKIVNAVESRRAEHGLACLPSRAA
jgi:transcriptional regulator with XRE-family HTH domain